jgi:hypothetical protein
MSLLIGRACEWYPLNHLVHLVTRIGTPSYRLRVAATTENRLCSLGFFILLGIEEYNYTIFLNTETDDYIVHR